MKAFSVLQFVQYVVLLLAVCFNAAHSRPGSIIKGTPYLFTTYNIAVDPNRGTALAPAFQQANGAYGANLVASFGTGKTP